MTSSTHTTELSDLEARICAVLRGNFDSKPQELGDPGGEFASTCADHGVLELVSHTLLEHGELESLSAATRLQLKRVVQAATAIDMIFEREAVSTIESLSDSGLDVLLMKGTPLAYSIYPYPALRSRCDTDFLVREADVSAVETLLRDAGYGTRNATSGDLVSYERAWYRQVTPDVLNALDLHWRLSNSQVFAELLTFDELYAAAVAVPQLGPSARALAPVHALILACTHRAGHFEGGRERGLLGRGDRLIWLYDVHLLIERLSESEIEEFVCLACSRGVRAVCLDALMQCEVCFGTHVPDRIVAEFSAAGPELTALLLEGSWSARTRAEFAALPSWGVRAKLLREMVLPPGDYMLNKYQVQSRWWLPALYLRRGIEGLAKIKARIAH